MNKQGRWEHDYPDLDERIDAGEDRYERQVIVDGGTHTLTVRFGAMTLCWTVLVDGEVYMECVDDETLDSFSDEALVRYCISPGF